MTEERPTFGFSGDAPEHTDSRDVETPGMTWIGNALGFASNAIREDPDLSFEDLWESYVRNHPVSWLPPESPGFVSLMDAGRENIKSLYDFSRNLHGAKNDDT